MQPAVCTYADIAVAMGQSMNKRRADIVEFFRTDPGYATTMCFEFAELNAVHAYDHVEEEPCFWYTMSWPKALGIFYHPEDPVWLRSTGAMMTSYKYKPLFVMSINGKEYCYFVHMTGTRPAVLARKTSISPFVIEIDPRFAREDTGSIVLKVICTSVFSGNHVCTLPIQATRRWSVSDVCRLTKSALINIGTLVSNRQSVKIVLRGKPLYGSVRIWEPSWVDGFSSHALKMRITKKTIIKQLVLDRWFRRRA
jgi:hypothetical protein